MNGCDTMELVWSVIFFLFCFFTSLSECVTACLGWAGLTRWWGMSLIFIIIFLLLTRRYGMTVAAAR